jgi:probable rRNA maturation factor
VAALIVLRNRQRRVRFDSTFVRSMAECAWPFCLRAMRFHRAPLDGLEEIEATIVSDRAIARVHRTFFNDPAPTDVITFPDGEILIGAGVVASNAARFGNTPSEEAALCLIHGLLHLAGWDDHTAPGAKDMRRKQEHIFKMARRMVCSRNP